MKDLPTAREELTALTKVLKGEITPEEFFGTELLHVIYMDAVGAHSTTVTGDRYTIVEWRKVWGAPIGEYRAIADAVAAAYEGRDKLLVNMVLEAHPVHILHRACNTMSTDDRDGRLLRGEY